LLRFERDVMSASQNETTDGCVPGRPRPSDHISGRESKADGRRVAVTDGQTVQCYQREMMCGIDTDTADDFRSRPTSMEAPEGEPDRENSRHRRGAMRFEASGADEPVYGKLLRPAVFQEDQYYDQGCRRGKPPLCSTKEERQQWTSHLVHTMPVIKGNLLPCPPTQPDGTQLRPHERSLTSSAQVKASAMQTDSTGPYALKRVAKRLEFTGSTAKMRPIVKTEQPRSTPNFDLTYTRNAPMIMLAVTITGAYLLSAMYTTLIAPVCTERVLTMLLCVVLSGT